MYPVTILDSPINQTW